MVILVTGGAGYVGVHSVIELVNAGHEVVVVDNLANSSATSLERAEKITGRPVPFHQLDLLDKESLRKVFCSYSISSVIHFAGLKAVGESCQIPLKYYRVNVGGTLSLLEMMAEFGVKRLVFSSSATVYGQAEYLPIDEKHPVGSGITNPYGKTKFFIEQILADVAAADEDFSVINLRYFNPVGAHPSGMVGEDPRGPPSNLMPFVSQVAIGRRPLLNVFGADYDTSDGTGVRDYIHVVDLARGHLSAVNKLAEMAAAEKAGAGEGKASRCLTLNLGTGKGYSVLEMIKGMEAASGKNIPYKICPRRLGDVAVCYGDVRLAESTLGWKAEKTLAEMCADLWNWQTKNPHGYAEEAAVNGDVSQ